MAEPMAVDEEISHLLRCAICSGKLTFPIMLVQSIGNMCKECYNASERAQSDNISIKNQALESVLSVVTLFCKYRNSGCNRTFPYEELIAHQDICRFKLRSCPMRMDCDWQGMNTATVEHCREKHMEMRVNFEGNLFILETTLKDLNLCKLLVTEYTCYMLRMKTNHFNNKLYYMICAAYDNTPLVDYTVKHERNFNGNHIKMKSQLLSYVNMYNDFDETIATEVDLDAIKNVLGGNDRVINTFQLDIEDAKIEYWDDKIMHYFECPVCKFFMKPPIFQCSSGHSICNKCRPKVERCPTCRAYFGTTRNYSLEGLTAGVKYPCIYHDLGCTKIANASDVSKHEMECTFKPFHCPSVPNCEFNSNYVGLLNHVMYDHEGCIVVSEDRPYTDTIRIDQVVNNKISEKKCLIALNHIFILYVEKLGDHYCWAVEIYGIYDESKPFVYEVAIVDGRKPERKIIKTDHCLFELNPQEELHKKSIIFPQNLLASFSKLGMVKYMIKIKESSD